VSALLSNLGQFRALSGEDHQLLITHPAIPLRELSPFACRIASFHGGQNLIRIKEGSQSSRGTTAGTTKVMATPEGLEPPTLRSEV
jgi:hypothetical protein